IINLKCVGASNHTTLTLQATNSFLSSIGRDNKITNTVSLYASLDNIFLNLGSVSGYPRTFK
ncbi:hypothetical protein, partial [Kingella kingae]|uniref:hypothetical protein n=1 Tax=Kingella kingae TaxID=504 RepID=UPI001E45B088